MKTTKTTKSLLLTWKDEWKAVGPNTGWSKARVPNEAHPNEARTNFTPKQPDTQTQQTADESCQEPQ